MQLNEIISTDKIVNIKGKFDTKGLGRELGSGLFAKVYEGKKPGTVVKVAYANQGTYDPYVSFVRVALNNQDNPYFPRIYSAKIYHNKIDEQIFVVVMEKLIPTTSEYINEAAENLKKQLGIDSNLSLFSQFSSSEGRSYLKHAAEKNGNEKFVEALDAMDDLLSHYKPDVHDANVMIRLTSVGPQFVFTDPVY